MRKWPYKNLNKIIVKILNLNPDSNIYLNIDHADYLDLTKEIKGNLFYTSNLSLVDLFDVISNCYFSLTIDTGPSHMSLRLGIKHMFYFQEQFQIIIQIISSYNDKKIKELDKIKITNRKSDNINVEYVWDYIKHEFD